MTHLKWRRDAAPPPPPFLSLIDVVRCTPHADRGTERLAAGRGLVRSRRCKMNYVLVPGTYRLDARSFLDN
jgi:hypothetical protein